MVSSSDSCPPSSRGNQDLMARTGSTGPRVLLAKLLLNDTSMQLTFDQHLSWGTALT